MDKHEKLGTVGRLFIILSVVFFIIFIITVQILTSASLFLIMLGFSPTLISCLLVIYLVETNQKHILDYSWFIPLIFVVAFYAIGTRVDSELFRGFDVPELAALNTLLSIAFISFLHLTGMSGRRMRHKSFAAKTALHEKTEPHPASLQVYIQSIEDKCKALNFVIGRVYSDKHGGSPELRNLIKMNKEHYNSFSNLTDFNDAKTKSVLLELVRAIANGLLLLRKTEHEVFGGRMHHLKNIQREHYGNDRIIDVLIKNDKDPVQTYFDSAIQFCHKAEVELVR
ncbi:hypothetical protein JXA85_07370 [Candidatus Woesearchaeota archaeon]|nr:hypothetical protein [Candidatus Woesearchaeota archaeon]